MNLETLFNPKSIAIVGASEEEGKIGNVLAKNILTLGYEGEVYLVNPKYETLFGKKCYKSLAELESTADLAVIAIPAKFVNAEIKNNADKIKNYVVISAGFSETSPDGRAREEELKKLAEEYGLNILGPNCLGFVIPKLKLNASFAGGLPEPGNIAFVTQSGALAVAMMDIAKKEEIKFSKIISVGNEAVMTESELLSYLGNDPDTKVIGMYLEGIRGGAEFQKVAREVSKIKPIVIIKAGKTERAQKAISSHTGALAGSDEIVSAMFKKSAIIRAQNLEEFFDLVDLISNTPVPKTGETAVITNAGGPGVLTTDAFLDKKIGLAEISEKIRNKLGEFLPEEASMENPIDLLGDAREDRYDKVLKLIGKEEKIGSVIAILTPQDQTPVEKIARKVISFKKKTEKTVVTVFIGGDRIRKAVKKLEDNNIPNFGFPDRAVVALDKYYRWNVFKNTALETAGPPIDESRKQKVTSIIQKAKSENRTALYFAESREVMEMYGVNTVECYEAPPKAELWENQSSALNFGFPVVLKVDSDQVLHKTDKKGLVLDIENQEELKKYNVEMRQNFPGERLIVQPMQEKGNELIIGIKRDEVFGPVLVYGLGGIYTEILKMVDFLLPPLNTEEIKKALLDGKIGFLFRETRGQKPYNLEELAGILQKISLLAQEISAISEFDINPLITYNNGAAAVAVDVKIII